MRVLSERHEINFPKKGIISIQNYENEKVKFIIFSDKFPALKVLSGKNTLFSVGF